jgi:predicted phosphodiesterase
MRIQLLSDLHFEFHADHGQSFVASMQPQGVDVLVLAGDIAVGDGIGEALDRFCAHYANATVVFVHGNHEFYGQTREHVLNVTREAVSRNANLKWLDGDVAVIDGRRFIGAPLWFRHQAEAAPYERMMNDFVQIRDFRGWVYAENKRALDLLERELRSDDIVVTHYLPAHASVVPKYRDSPLTPFFLCDVEPLIRARQPTLWLHGHTHDSLDYTLGSTTIRCNPFGYARHELNPNFVDHCIIEV